MAVTLKLIGELSKTLLAALLVAAVASPAMGQDVTINIGGGGGRSYGPATTRVDLGAYSNGGYAGSNSARYSGNNSRESWGSNYQRYDHDHHHDYQHDQIVKQGCGLPKCSRQELGLK